MSAWYLAWPLIAFMVMPLVAGLSIWARLPELAQLGLEHLPRVALMALLVRVTLYIIAALPEFTLLKGGAGMIGFAVAFAVIGLVIGYVIGPLGSSNRGDMVFSTAALTQRNTSVAIMTLIFALGAYAIIGVTLLVASLLTIVVLLFVTADWSKRYTAKQGTAQKAAQSGSSG